MLQASKIMTGVTLLLMSSCLLVFFQNCGSMAAQDNPLYGSDDIVGCVGINCERDLSSAGIATSVQGVMIDNKLATSTATACDEATCFDIGGFCETGGYPTSVFYYRWTLSGQLPEDEVRTGSACDETGRFRVLVRVPFTKFNWTQSHQLLLSMKVIDENGVEQLNPNGEAQWNFVVSVRQ